MVKSRSLDRIKKKSVLDKTLDFFAHSTYNAYLVGGYVRDTSLGIDPIDIDIVVEGDAQQAARNLNKRLKGKLSVYKAFGTASIVTSDKQIDLASTRVERYPSPAQLPQVSPSTILEDLNRRDFTINAIAMSISKKNFGEIFDPFNGLNDIDKGLIRILHKDSFVDDPTRIFRALRYKYRFRFKIEKKTKMLMKYAIEKKFIERLSNQRILNEIRLVFAEKNYAKIVKDLSNYRIFRLKKKDLDMLTRSGDRSLYFFLSRLNYRAYPLTAHEKRIVNDMKQLRGVISRLHKTNKNSTMFRILSPLSEDALQCISTLRHDLREKITQFKELQTVEPYISGNDLKRLGCKPNKRFKSILKTLYSLQLDHVLKTRKEALAYLKKSMLTDA